MPRQKRQNRRSDHQNNSFTSADAQAEDSSIQIDTAKKMTDTHMISLLPVYEGQPTESVEFFYEQFKQITSLTAWTETQQAVIIKTRLRAKAHEFLSKNTRLQKETNVENVVKALREKFEPEKSITQKQAKFQNIRFKPETDLEDLAQEVDKLTNEFLGISDEASEEILKVADGVKFGKFLELIPSDIKMQIQLENLSDFKTAVKRAKEIKIILDEDAYVNNNIQCKNKDEQMYENKTEIVNSLERKITELEREIKTMGTRNKYCDFCEKPGHTRGECRILNKLKNKDYLNDRGQGRSDMYAQRDSHSRPHFRNSTGLADRAGVSYRRTETPNTRRGQGRETGNLN